jgi:hypothetical protein
LKHLAPYAWYRVPSYTIEKQVKLQFVFSLRAKSVPVESHPKENAESVNAKKMRPWWLRAFA